ncbi:hypothetical protein ACPA0F_18610 [Solibacillus silvestris]
MVNQLKTVEQTFDESAIAGLIGKTIHVPTNKHTVKQQAEDGSLEDTVVNAWFAGEVAGYEKALLQFDFTDGKFMDKPKVFFNILLTDGMSYQLALTESEIIELDEAEFATLLAEHQAAIDVEKKALELIVPEKPQIILPGR